MDITANKILADTAVNFDIGDIRTLYSAGTINHCAVLIRGGGIGQNRDLIDCGVC